MQSILVFEIPRQYPVQAHGCRPGIRTVCGIPRASTSLNEAYEARLFIAVYDPGESHDVETTYSFGGT